MTDETASSAAEQLEFLGKLQRILNEGQFVASYKYALIMSIAELCVEKAQNGDATLHLPLQEIAERFVALYWRQAAPFAGGRFLRHNSGGEASAVLRIRAFQERAPTLTMARRDRRWPALIRSICRLLIEMPLWRLQLVGADRLDFLYKEELIEEGIVLRAGVARRRPPKSASPQADEPVHARQQRVRALSEESGMNGLMTRLLEKRSKWRRSNRLSDSADPVRQDPRTARS